MCGGSTPTNVYGAVLHASEGEEEEEEEEAEGGASSSNGPPPLPLPLVSSSASWRVVAAPSARGAAQLEWHSSE